MIKRVGHVFAPMAALAIFLAVSAGTVGAQQQNKTSAQYATAAAQPAGTIQQQKSTDTTAPSYDMKAQSLQDLDQMHKQFVSLLEAMPDDKLTWRPAEGVRSVSELYLHVSMANYGIPNMMGAPMPTGIDPKTFEKSTTDKEQIVAALNKSFDSAHAAIAGMTNADFAKALPKLGPDANDGDVVYILVTHAHEHLGQAIAYARINGVVPPWTAAALKKAAANGGPKLQD
jgi:uncharacterized damage-inducible protein DinB